MKLYLLFAIAFSLSARRCSSQVHEGELSNADSSNFETIRQAIQYLKNKETVSLTSFNAESATIVHSFYKEFLGKYFDLGFLLDTSDKHALMTERGQLLILYNIDHVSNPYFLDNLGV